MDDVKKEKFLVENMHLYQLNIAEFIAIGYMGYRKT